MADVIVVGAGLAGLACAFRLQQQGLDVRVVERAEVPGGAMRTMQRDGWRYEWGPNSFLGSATALHGLAKELGLEVVAARDTANKRYMFLDGKLQSMPANPADAITSDALPASAKLRLLSEPFRRGGVRDDESVREFFERRLGREFTDRFVDAFVSGVYAGDIAQLGIAAVFPKVFAMVREHGSLTRGAMASMKGKKGGPRGTFSFPGGLGDLPAALARSLADRLELGADVSLEREPDGWRVGAHRAPEVVLASPAFVSARLVASFAAPLAAELDALPYAPIAGVHLLLRAGDLKKPLDGFGFLIPRREKVRLLGCIWSSAMFDVAKADHVAMTCFIGGAHDHAALELSDEALVAEVRRDLATTMGLADAPVDVAVVRHARAIPQYGIGHVAWRERVASLVGAQRGLSLAGNFLEGVSMSDTVAQAERAASAVVARHGTARAA